MLWFSRSKTPPEWRENQSAPVALTEFRSIDAFKQDADHVEEVVIARLTEEEIFKLSEEAFVGNQKLLFAWLESCLFKAATRRAMELTGV